VAESPLNRYGPAAALGLVTAAAFARVPFGSFHFDDYLLLNDPSITSPTGFGGFWQLTTTRPLSWITFWLNYQLFAAQPLGWHLANLLLHFTCSALLFVCLRRLFPPTVALTAAALFALHPLQVEPVALVYSRSVLLCTLFCLLALRAWLIQRPWQAVAWFAVALTGKEECVFFPLFLGLALPRKPRALAAMLALSAVAGARVLVATKFIAGSGAGFSAKVSSVDYLMAQGAVIWRYAGQVLLPIRLNFDPDLHPPGWAGLVGWLLLAGLAVVLLSRRTHWPPAVWFLGSLVLLMASSSVFPADDLAADRRMYLPWIALAPALALLTTRLPRAAVAAIIALLAVLTLARTAVWSSELTLWSDTVQRSPAKLRPRLQLARALPPEAALLQLETAARLEPASPLVPAERGRVHLQMNRADLAIADFGQAAAAEPGNPQHWNSLGGAFSLLDQPAAARRAFERALRLDPCYLDSRRNLDLAPCR
jgi:tetratricopeptide (TPR) repeat protein